MLTNFFKLFAPFIFLFSTHLSAQKRPIIIIDTTHILVDSSKPISIDNTGPLFTGSRNSTRSNGDKCCPNAVNIDRGNGTSKKLKPSIFENEKVKGPIEVYAYNTNGQALDLSKAIKFSKDDSILTVDMLCCPRPLKQGESSGSIFDTLGDIILEFRVSGGKKNFITLSKLNSWPPDISKPRSRLLNN